MALSLPDRAAWTLMQDKTPEQTGGADGVYVADLRKGSASFRFF
jgi:hypothetical protein